jgi:hypothetical protein
MDVKRKYRRTSVRPGTIQFYGPKKIPYLSYSFLWNKNENDWCVMITKLSKVESEQGNFYIPLEKEKVSLTRLKKNTYEATDSSILEEVLGSPCYRETSRDSLVADTIRRMTIPGFSQIFDYIMEDQDRLGVIVTPSMEETLKEKRVKGLKGALSKIRSFQFQLKNLSGKRNDRSGYAIYLSSTVSWTEYDCIKGTIEVQNAEDVTIELFKTVFVTDVDQWLLFL